MSKEINDTIPPYLRDVVQFASEPRPLEQSIYHKVVQHWFTFHLFQAFSAQYGRFNIHQVAEPVIIHSRNGDYFDSRYLRTPDGKLTGFGYTIKTHAFHSESHGVILAERIATEFCSFVNYVFQDTGKIASISHKLDKGQLTIDVTWAKPWGAITTTGDQN